MKRARVVEIAFAPKLSRMPEITLRKNAFLIEPRVGEALGKIIGYSIALDGSDGRINCEVRIGCAIGRGGSATATDGTPTYCSIDYAGADYQQFIDRTVLCMRSSDRRSVISRRTPAPNDDGIDFLSALRAEDVIEVPLVVENGPEAERVQVPPNDWRRCVERRRMMKCKMYSRLRAHGSRTIMRQYENRATFKLKSMTREFSSDYEIQVTDLKIPTGYDLEVV